MNPADIDTAVFFFINRGLQNSLFDVVMPFVTSKANLLFFPFVLWAFIKDRSNAWKFLLVSLVAVALADGSGNLLKHLFERQRPCNALKEVNLLVGCSSSFSLPSNHASNAFAFAVVFFIMTRGLHGLFFLMIAAAVGFSRVYVGVHYPLDVLSGALLGVVSAFVAMRLYDYATYLWKRRSYEGALYLALAVISVFRVYYILTSPFDLSADEAHYWEWSRRPDWSYYSKGPMVAYLIYAGTALFGNSVFGVRIFAVVLSACGSLVLFRLGRELYDEQTGLCSALLIQAVPLFSVYGVLLTIDSPFIFFWILSLFFFWRAVQGGAQEPGGEGRIGNWVALGISVGLGLLTKYTMSLFFLCGLSFFVFRKVERRYLSSKGPYLALLISLVLFMPVIFWNANHGWVTLKHTAGQANVHEGLVISPKFFFEFIGSQLGVVTPVLLVMSLVALLRLRRERRGDFLAWFTFPIILFFVFKSLQGKVQANWALPGYVGGFIAFSACFFGGSPEQFSKARESIKAVKISKEQGLAVSAVLIAAVVTALAYYPAVLHLPPKLDPTKKLVGWKELGQEVGRISHEMSREGPLFIFSDSYQIASELAFYIKGNPVTYCINLGRRMNQYDLWPGFGDLKGYNAIFVMGGEEEMPELLARAFGRYELLDITVETRKARQVKFSVVKCYDFTGVETKPLERY